jgi:hypothetical protein
MCRSTHSEVIEIRKRQTILDERQKQIYSAVNIGPPLSPPIEYVPPAPVPDDLVAYHDHFFGGTEESNHEIQVDAPPAYPSYPSHPTSSWEPWDPSSFYQGGSSGVGGSGGWQQ